MQFAIILRDGKDANKNGGTVFSAHKLQNKMNCLQKRRRSVLCAALCAILLGCSAMAALAVEADAESGQELHCAVPNLNGGGYLISLTK